MERQVNERNALSMKDTASALYKSCSNEEKVQRTVVGRSMRRREWSAGVRGVVVRVTTVRRGAVARVGGFALGPHEFGVVACAPTSFTWI
eukprot:9577061-Lingulodinium_polyedra.AAC.1